MSQKRKRSPSPSLGEENSSKLYRSSPIEDRASTFIAIYSPTASSKTLQALPEFKSASHRMAAWRKPSKQRSLTSKPICDSGYDDDGEQYGGKRLENVLRNLDVIGSVVVARWYGGVMLGPVRFTHIEECAKEAISTWRTEVAEAERRKKADEEEVIQRTNLIEILEQRDQSITVLRQLLAEKQAAVTKTQGADRETSSEAAATTASPSRAKPNYSVMITPTLQRLEKARDGTIAWILKEIDKVEEQQSKGGSLEDQHELDDSNAAHATVVQETSQSNKGETPESETPNPQADGTKTNDPEAETPIAEAAEVIIAQDETNRESLFSPP